MSTRPQLTRRELGGVRDLRILSRAGVPGARRLSNIKHQQNNFLWTEAVNLKSREERALAAWTGWRWSTNTKSNGSGWIGSVKLVTTAALKKSVEEACILAQAASQSRCHLARANPLIQARMGCERCCDPRTLPGLPPCAVTLTRLKPVDCYGSSTTSGGCLKEGRDLGEVVGMGFNWDTLGGNEGQWERQCDSVYDQQARVAGRRSSPSYGEGGGWYEAPPGVGPPDLDLKRASYPYQDSSYGQVYTDRHDTRGFRKSSVPDINHYERVPMAHRGSIPHQDYYSHDPTMTPRPPEGIYRPEHQPPPPHPHQLSRSGSHFGIAPGARTVWDQTQPGRSGPQAPSSPLPPQPPPTAHELSRTYREPGAITIAKVMQDGQQRLPSRDLPPGHYGMDHPTPRYASEPPPLTGPSVYTDVDGRPLDSQQQVATCLVVDPATQASPLPAPPSMPPVSSVPQTPVPVDPKKTVDPEFLSLLRNEGLSESTISSLIQQGFDSSSLLVVMEENDVRTVAPNLGQARVLSRLVHNYKRPIEATPVPSRPQTPMRGRSNSFSHRSDIYQQQHHHHPPHLSQALAVDPQLMPPPTPGIMQTISPRIGEVVSRRPSSAPSQNLMEVTGGYPGQPPRSPGPYTGALMPVQSRPMSAYSAGVTMPGVPMQVPMELMKRDRNLLPLSPMHSPHPSPQLIRKGGGSAADNAMVAVGAPVQGQSALTANQKLSRRTGPPVIVSTMASPDTSGNENRERER
ncbi:hypothetical protein CCH79_00001766 [Gambusia affinis]|uniref:Uncharacterized protein n=1 Tax=Gambusia affinis TaxID=33528 RepID=A0A315VSE4_GAMAF|nr:hypothetical protein CCH79_00001766 [Gambusia affinis]